MTALPGVVFDGVIDVSHHNGRIDWAAVAGAGIALALIKATQGTGFVDPCFVTNRAAASAAGVLAIPYHFLDLADAAAQARHFLAIAKPAPGQPVMLDWEVACGSASLVAIGNAVIAVTRRDPVAYYGAGQLAGPEPTLSRWPLMLPEYPRGTTAGDYRSLVSNPPRSPIGRRAERPYDFHQYTPAGRVAGITGPVDRSVWIGTLDEMRRWFRG